jgi:hypothetical protein
LLFYLLLALKRDNLGRYTGGVAVVQGFVTGFVPSFLLLTGRIADIESGTLAIVLAVVGIVVFAGLYVKLKAPVAA